MIINLSNLNEGEHFFSFNITSDDLDLKELNFVRDIKISLKLFKTSNQVDIKVNIDSIVNVPCDRCLEDFDFIINKDFELIYKYSYDKSWINTDDDVINDFKIISPDVHNINLKNELRDYILLSFPLKCVPEVNDDICSLCKKNVNEVLRIQDRNEINPI